MICNLSYALEKESHWRTNQAEWFFDSAQKRSVKCIRSFDDAIDSNASQAHSHIDRKIRYPIFHFEIFGIYDDFSLIYR